MSLEDRAGALLRGPEGAGALQAVRAGAITRAAAREERRAPWFAKASAVAPSDGDAEYEGWPDLVEDLFRLHHEFGSPEIEDPAALRADHRMHAALMRDMEACPETAQARAWTRNRETESAIATMAGGRVLWRALNDALAETAEAREDAEDAQRRLDALEAQAEESPEEGGEIAAARAEAVEAREQAERALAAAVASASTEAASEAKEAAKAVASAPGIGAGSGARMDPELRLALAERWSQDPRLRRIAELCGRLQRDIRAGMTREVKGAPGRPVGVRQGADLRRMLPHERVRFAHAALRPEAIARYAERRLSITETAGPQRASRGPLMVVVDSSDSMKGDRILWAKALTLALVGIAHAEGRGAAVVEFSSRRAPDVDRLPAGRTNPARLLEIAERFHKGGTEPVPALTEALEIIAGGGAFERADLVVITDGEARIDDATRDIRARMIAMGVRCHAVAIAGGGREYLGAVADEITEAHALVGSSSSSRAIGRGLAGELPERETPDGASGRAVTSGRSRT